MYADGPNPSKVQLCPPTKRANPPIPLVLLHDGGGTTFSYFILGPLGREVWAIHDPNYFESKRWEGGMDAMAEHYIKLIEDAGIKGPVFLGGWSLGGYMSLTMSRMLADRPDAKFSVVGMLIIDSPLHVARGSIEQKMSKVAMDNVPELIQNSFDNCDTMLQDWDLPAWEGPALGGKTVAVRTGGKRFEIEQGKLLFKALGEDWETIDHGLFKHEPDQEPANPKTPPPGVMIRCVQEVKKAEGSGEEPTMIDLFRQEKLLGWEGRHADFLKAMIEFDSHHYDCFDKMDDAKGKLMTANLKEGLEILDSLAPPKPQIKQVPMMDFF